MQNTVIWAKNVVNLFLINEKIGKFIPSENIRKTLVLVFRGYKMLTLARTGLNVNIFILIPS